MNILDQIIAHKREEIRRSQTHIPLATLQDSKHYARLCLSLVKMLKNGPTSGIIAEHKRRSPSKGMIGKGRSVTEVVKGYEEAGATAVSVLTDQHFFGGQAQDLLDARSQLSIPILRKDFIVDRYQIHEAKAWGADVILLIAEALEKGEVQELAAEANALGLEVLMEMHDETGLAKVSDDVNLIGINNRDLKTFTVDLDKSIELLNQLPDNRPAIAESGIDSPATMARLRQAGFAGFLIGETFMKTPDPGLSCKAFIEDEQNIQVP
ncbi:MAG: indole-3-glycerol phosphate synthase TrpC [Saprospiraceae bacterium]|nr:indole-3-glycerol phosphate synthase TrpC [Saprospiraceae bacterium]